MAGTAGLTLSLPLYTAASSSRAVTAKHGDAAWPPAPNSSLPSREKQSESPQTANRATASPQIARRAGSAAGIPPPSLDCNHCARLPSRWRHSAAGVSQRPQHAPHHHAPRDSPGACQAHTARTPRPSHSPSTGFQPVSPIRRRFPTGGALRDRRSPARQGPPAPLPRAPAHDDPQSVASTNLL